MQVPWEYLGGAAQQCVTGLVAGDVVHHQHLRAGEQQGLRGRLHDQPHPHDPRRPRAGCAALEREREHPQRHEAHQSAEQHEHGPAPLHHRTHPRGQGGHDDGAGQAHEAGLERREPHAALQEDRHDREHHGHADRKRDGARKDPLSAGRFLLLDGHDFLTLARQRRHARG